MRDEQKRAAVELFGEEFVAELIEAGEKKTDDLEAEGLIRKEEETEEKEDVTVPAEAEETTTEESETEQGEKATIEDVMGVLDTLQAGLAALQEMQTTQTEQINELRDNQDVQIQKAFPRYVQQMIDQRASGSTETEVNEEDIKDKAPKETKPKEGQSVAASFFGPK